MMHYLILAILSLAAGIAVYWFAIKLSDYLRFRRFIEFVSLSDNENDTALNRASEKHSLEQGGLSRIRRRLLLAGISLPLWQVGTATFLLTALISAGMVWFLRHPFGIVLGLFFGPLLIYMGVESQILRRKIEFNRAFAITISVLVKMMRNGIGFEQALVKSIESSNSERFRNLFGRFLQEKNRIGEQEAFANMNRHIDSKELRVFALAVKIGRESGGHFSATLEKVEQTIRYRKKIQDKIGVVTREAMIGSYLVAAIGILLYFMFDFNFNGKVTTYFFDSEWGRWQLLGIILWILAGLGVNNWITRIER